MIEEVFMRVGMLWFDNDPKTDLSTKIHQAAVYYQKKYGCKPDICFVHPSMLKTESISAPRGIEIRPNRVVLPHHLWLGIREANATPTV
jgi:hypothetical protein